MFLSIRTPKEDPLDSPGFLRGSLFDNTEQSSLEIPELTFNAEEFLNAHNETLALRRYGAFFLDYLYTMDIEPEKDPDSVSDEQVDGLEVVGEIRLVKELSFKRLILGPTHLQLSSSMVHRMELVSKLSFEDIIPRKGENFFYGKYYTYLISKMLNVLSLHMSTGTILPVPCFHYPTHPWSPTIVANVTEQSTSDLKLAFGLLLSHGKPCTVYLGLPITFHSTVL